MVRQGRGKRAGARRAARRAPRFDPTIAILAVAITVCVVAWGYLVKAAIDFGTSARNGDGGWFFLGLACLGAAGCLFVGLILIARLLAAIGVLPESATGPNPNREQDHPSTVPPPRRPATSTETLSLPLPKDPDGRRVPGPRPPGGKRAAR